MEELEIPKFILEIIYFLKIWKQSSYFKKYCCHFSCNNKKHYNKIKILILHVFI